MRYFEISRGLRGCYMSDNFYMAKCETRRELRELIADETRADIDSGFAGLSKRAIAGFAAEIWRGKYTGLPLALPYGEPRKNSKPFGIFVSEAGMREFRKYEKDQSEWN